MKTTRSIIMLVLGLAMFFIGLFVAVRPLFTHNAILTGARWLDIAFAAVFMLRGVVNVRTATKRG